MRYLKQPTDYTCGQTSVAMVAGVSISKVREIVKSGWNKKHWFGEKTSSKDLCRALRALKIKHKKLHRLKKDEILPEFCIVHMRIPRERWSHWVVFKGLKWYDPYYGKSEPGKPLPKWPPRLNVTSYIEITK